MRARTTSSTSRCAPTPEPIDPPVTDARAARQECAVIASGAGRVDPKTVRTALDCERVTPVFLVLEVISPQASELGSAARQTFDTTGGTLGRIPGNSWVLPHLKVSKKHAVISYAGGVFYIEDKDSMNGVFLNSSRNRLTRGQPHPLSSGDRLLIEPYEIR